jgi:cold shock CspA family protein
MRGTLRFFNPIRGFGMIIPDELPAGGRDTFVHISEWKKAKLGELPEGTELEYDEGTRDGRPIATNLRVII